MTVTVTTTTRPYFPSANNYTNNKKCYNGYMPLTILCMFVVLHVHWLMEQERQREPEQKAWFSSAFVGDGKNKQLSSSASKLQQHLQSYSANTKNMRFWEKPKDYPQRHDESLCRFGPLGLHALRLLGGDGSTWKNLVVAAQHNQTSQGGNNDHDRHTVTTATTSMTTTSIPPNLILTHRALFFQTRKPHALYKNVQNTIHTYRQALIQQQQQQEGEEPTARRFRSERSHDTSNSSSSNYNSSIVSVLFLTNYNCCSLVYQAHADLALYFDRTQNGKHRADMCRLAALYIHRGYYFDVDLTALHEAMIPQNQNIRFVATAMAQQDIPTSTTTKTTSNRCLKLRRPKQRQNRCSNGKGKEDKRFFPAFLAAAPGHPILRQAWKKWHPLRISIISNNRCCCCSSRSSIEKRVDCMARDTRGYQPKRVA